MAECDNKGRVLSKDCPVDEEPNREGQPFSLCVGNYTLHYDGYVLWTERRAYQIPDGTFTQITFTDGCITGVGQAPVAGYTPSDCCGPPGSPGTGPGGGEGQEAISPVACNLLARSTQGLYVTPHILGVNGVSVSGCGTAADPLTISATPTSSSGAEIHALSPNNTLAVNGTGTNTAPLTIDLRPIGAATTYNGLDVDQYGRVTGYTNVSVGQINAVVGGRGINVTTTNGVATVELAGAASLAAGSFYTPPDPVLGGTGKRVYYDANGFITSVVAV